MEKLLINPTGHVTQFIDKYKIWKDYKKFYHNDSTPSMVEIDHSGIPVFYYREISKINDCSSPIIGIDCLTEGLNCYKKYFSRYRKDKHYIFFSNGTWLKNSNNIDLSYDIVHHLLFLFEYADTYLSPNRFCFYFDKKYKFEYPKPCMFVSTIGNVRTERTYFVDKLKEKLRYNNFILKYSGEDLGLPSNNLDVVNFEKGQFDPYTNILHEYYHTVSGTLPIDMYNQAYFNIVVETDIDYVDDFFLTEKTIKALVTGIPFVVVSTPNFLKNLQQLGFTTYNQVWDESYDSITNYNDRMEAIVDLCSNLKKLDWNFYKPQLEEIQLKNQNNFLHLNKIATQEFRHFENLIKQL